MLEFKRGEWNRCTLTVDNLRISKTRKALVFYLRDLGLPLAAAKFVVKRALYAKFSGVRVYRLTALHYIYVDYDEGSFRVGTEEQVEEKIREQHPWQQACLWIEMADAAAWGRKMSRKDIDGFIYDFETDLKGIELITKNVAPIERLRRKRRRRRRKVKKVLSKIYGYEDL